MKKEGKRRKGQRGRLRYRERDVDKHTESDKEK